MKLIVEKAYILLIDTGVLYRPSSSSVSREQLRVNQIVTKMPTCTADKRLVAFFEIGRVMSSAGNISKLGLKRCEVCRCLPGNSVWILGRDWWGFERVMFEFIF